MKMVVDNQIVRLLVSRDRKTLENPLISNSDNHLSFRWPSLLEYLGLGSIFSKLPEFDQSQPLFVACVSALCTHENSEDLFHVYDRLFAEVLNQINALPEIKASYLLEAINEKQQIEMNGLLSPALANYETLLTENASHTMHDLILYLAWDRMCVCMARLFDYQSTDPKFLRGISVFRDCLIESFLHITQQGKTAPGIWRMLEAFLFYQMREENLEKLSAAEWTMFSQSFQLLKAQEELVDFFYIDDAIVLEKEGKVEEQNSVCYVTLDSFERVDARISLAQHMIGKLISEVSNWGYVLRPKKIVYLDL